MIKISNSWDELLACEFKKKYFKDIIGFVARQRLEKKVFPPSVDVFNAFKLTPYEEVKLVIIGQDPYHEEGEANGLAFSVNRGIKIPPSLRNIYKEICDEFEGFDIASFNHGDLSNWARRGVLLLNTTLTVEEGKANSHAKIGWQTFTDEVIRILNNRGEKIVFILLGKTARDKKRLITNGVHSILEAAHPSPLSAYRGFFGSGIFKRACKELGYAFDWSL